jgi:hypothetical protein
MHAYDFNMKKEGMVEVSLDYRNDVEREDNRQWIAIIKNGKEISFPLPLVMRAIRG